MAHSLRVVHARSQFGSWALLGGEAPAVRRDLEPRALTVPSVSRLLLMKAPSFLRMPALDVALEFSDPARSIRFCTHPPSDEAACLPFCPCSARSSKTLRGLP